MSTETHNQPTTPTTDPNEFQEVLQKAHSGDLMVLPRLRQLLDADRRLWQEAGDLAAHAEMSLARLVSGKDLYLLEALLKRLAELKSELAGPEATPLEKLLVDRIGVSWLQVHHADLDLVTSRARDGGATTLSLYAQRRLDSAHKRYLAAVKQLALVRKLLMPQRSPLQIATRLEEPIAVKRRGRPPKCRAEVMN